MPHACFYITGHGLGHASRCQAVAEALLELPGWSIELRTSAPRSCFSWLLSARCSYSFVELDPGVQQSDSFHHDIPGTYRVWHDLLEQSERIINEETAHLRSSAATVVLSDISPLPCRAARRAAIPCAALGNFTWDWILATYLAAEPRFIDIIATLKELYHQATVYLRLPLSPDTNLFATQQSIPFIARRARVSAAQARQLLGIAPHEHMVLVSFGGFGIADLRFPPAALASGIRYVWDRPHAEPPHLISTAKVGLLYSDLVRAADIILTKPGFSIIAEAVAQKKPVLYAPRPSFRENELLVEFLQHHWPSIALQQRALAEGSWVDAARELACTSHHFPTIRTDGAAVVALALCDLIR